MEWNAFQFLHREPSGIDRVDTVSSGPRKAFTLAEVLITLAIIGVVAALTIPTVVKNYKEKQIVTQLKKTFSQVNSAYQMAIVDYGSPETWDWGANNTKSTNDIIFNKYFAPYLKILKKCGENSGCVAEAYKTLDKTNVAVNITPTTSSSAVLADGSTIVIDTFKNKCKSISGFPPENKYRNICASFAIDINGAKEPNVMGKDAFRFYVSKYGIIPVGVKEDNKYNNFNNTCNRNGVRTDNGVSCAAWILARDNMDYLKKDISW